MRVRRLLATLLLGATLASCSPDERAVQQSETQVPAAPASPVDASRETDLEALLEGVTILDHTVARPDYIVVLEMHATDGRAINPEAAAVQGRIYDAVRALQESGYSNLFAESISHQVPIETLINTMQHVRPEWQLGRLLDSDEATADRLVRNGYLEKGIETYILASLVDSDSSLTGLETTDALIRQQEFNQLTLQVDSLVNGGQWNYFKADWEGSRSDPLTPMFVAEFNEAIDYLQSEYEWYISGRSEAMVEHATSTSQQGILFVGQNHYQSVVDALNRRNKSYTTICGDCTKESILTVADESAQLFTRLDEYRIK